MSVVQKWQCHKCKTVNTDVDYCLNDGECFDGPLPEAGQRRTTHMRCEECTILSVKEDFKKRGFDIKSQGKDKDYEKEQVYMGDGCVELSKYKAPEKRGGCGCVIL